MCEIHQLSVYLADGACVSSSVLSTMFIPRNKVRIRGGVFKTLEQNQIYKSHIYKKIGFDARLTPYTRHDIFSLT